MKTMLKIAAGAAFIATGFSSAQAQEELVESCYLILSSENSEPLAMEMGVMEMTAPGAEVSLDIPDGEQLAAISCVRTQLRLAENDYMMAMWGIPLIVYADSEEGERSGVLLTIEDDQFTVQVAQGELTDEDRAALVESLEGFYAALESDSGE